MKAETLKAGYITIGSVRGACPHIHRTIEAAQACLDRDQRGCASQHGYSDRRIVRVDGDYSWDLDEDGSDLRETSDVCRSQFRGYYIRGGN